MSETEGVIRTPRWITALGTLRYSDLFASGEPRFWTRTNDRKPYRRGVQGPGTATFGCGKSIRK